MLNFRNSHVPTLIKLSMMLFFVFLKLMFLARLLGEHNEMGAAVEAYKRSIEMEPVNVDLIHSLGMLYMKVSALPTLAECREGALKNVPVSKTPQKCQLMYLKCSKMSLQ